MKQRPNFLSVILSRMVPNPDRSKIRSDLLTVAGEGI